MSRIQLRPALRAYAHAPTVETAVAWEDSTKSLAYDGSNDYVMGSALAFDPTQAYSVSLWFRVSVAFGSTTDTYTLWRSGDASSHSRSELQIVQTSGFTGCRIVFKEGSGAGGSGTNFEIYSFFDPTWSVIQYKNPQLGEWNHLAVTSTSTSSAAGVVKLFFNGQEVDSMTGKQYTGTNDLSAPSIGSSGSISSFRFKGNIDQVATYQRVLSASDVADLCGPDNYQRKPQTPYLSSGGPIHLWAMGEYVTGTTMPDQIGSADMTLYNGPTVSTDVAPAPWATRWSLKFDGTDDKLSGACPFNPALAFSISFWIKFDPSPTSYDLMILIDGGSPETRRFRIQYFDWGTDRGFVVYFRDGFNSGGVNAHFNWPAADWPLDNWGHIVITDSSTSSTTGDQKCYANGTLMVTRTGNEGMDPSATVNNLEIGGWQYGNYFSGNMDEMAFFNRAISASEVTALYNSGSPTDVMNTAGVTADAVAWYRMGDRWNKGVMPDQIGSVDLTMSSAPEPEEDVPVWTPAAMTTRIWYDASDASTIAESGGAVSQWSDKSGNGHHATQSDVAKQPTYSATGLGSLPAISFDGNSVSADRDVLVTATGCYSSTDVVSCFAVYKSLSSSDPVGFSTIATLGLGSYAQLGAGYQVSSNRAISYIWGYGVNYVTNTDLQNPNILGVTRAAAGSGYTTIHDNGTATADTVLENLTLGSTSSTYLGNSADLARPANAAISEVLIFGSALSTADVEKIEGYLAWKWDGGTAGTLVGKLPASHPYKSGAPTS